METAKPGRVEVKSQLVLLAVLNRALPSPSAWPYFFPFFRPVPCSTHKRSLKAPTPIALRIPARIPVLLTNTVPTTPMAWTAPIRRNLLSPACSEQNQSPNSLQGPQSRSPQFPRYGTQSGTQNQNYSDMEQLSRLGNSAAQPPLPPEPLSEFQKFIASSTGQVLPIFGANLFRRVPSTFAPVDLGSGSVRFCNRTWRRAPN